MSKDFMDIEIKSTAELIDSLITTSMKCYHAQDKICDENLSDEERLNAAVTAQKTNAKRTALLQAINKRLGESTFLETKTYG